MKDFVEFIKSLPYLLITAVLVVGGVWVYGEWKDAQRIDALKSQITALQQETVQLKNGVAAVTAQQVDPKELREHLSSDLQSILDDYDLDPSSNIGGTGHVGPNVTHDPAILYQGKARTEIYWPKDEQGNRIKIATSVYDIDFEEFENTVHPLEFNLDVTTATDVNNHEAVFATLEVHGDTGENYRIKIDNLEVQKVYPKKKEWRLATHIDGGISTKIDTHPKLGASIGVTPFAYGRTKDDNLVRAPRLGLAGNEDHLWIELQAEYNLGKNIPIFSDLWTGAGVCYDSDGKYGTCVTINSTF